MFQARAFRILEKEALRHNYDHWKIWENFLLVACDLQEWTQVVRAYNRLVTREQVLLLLCIALVEIINQSKTPDVY